MRDGQRSTNDKESSKGLRLQQVDEMEKEQSVRTSNCGQLKCQLGLTVAFLEQVVQKKFKTITIHAGQHVMIIVQEGERGSQNHLFQSWFQKVKFSATTRNPGSVQRNWAHHQCQRILAMSVSKNEFRIYFFH